MKAKMSPLESTATGFALVGAGAGLIVWGYRHHGTWLEGENSPEEGHYSVHRPPSAPGIKRMAIGVVFIIVGVILLAPSVAGF